MLTTKTQSGHDDSASMEKALGNKMENSLTDERIRTADRQDQFLYIAQAMTNTEPPAVDEAEKNAFVPTSIEFAGPGNYGKKEFEDENEVVLLNDDVLTSVANATVVIVDGNDLERMAVLYQFPQFLEHCPDECIRIMVPRICSEAVSWSSTTQMAAVEALYFVVNREAPTYVCQKIVFAALAMTTKAHNNEVFDACGEIVSMILPQVHRYDVLQFVVPYAVERSTSDESVKRKLAARVIGSLNDALTAMELQMIFKNTIHDLAHDSDDSVRAMIAQSMAAVGEKFPLDAVEEKVYPLLQKLYNDKQHQVSVASLKAIAKTALAHRESAKESFLYTGFFRDIFIKECNRAAAIAARDLRTVDDNTYVHLEVFAEVYGRFLYAVSDCIDDDEVWTNVLNTLRLMITCNGPTVRHWCAYNMPAIAHVCAQSKTDRLAGVITALAGDTDTETRSTLAAGIHEITRSLYPGPLSEDVIQMISTLFTDDNAQVRMNALTRFSDLVSLVSPGAQEIYDRTRAESARKELNADEDLHEEDDIMQEDNFSKFSIMFSSLELMSFDSWRTQQLLAEQIRKCAHLIPQNMLCEHIAPLLFQMARESTSLVRKASMEALIFVIKYIPEVKKRNHIVKHFKTEWARGKVFWTRLAFIDGAELASKLFSNNLFTKLFKDELLSMRNDRVRNIRHRLGRLLIHLVPIWKNDENFRNAVKHLASDDDTEVSKIAMEILEKMTTDTGPSQKDIHFNQQMEMLETEFYFTSANKKRRGQPVQSAQSTADQVGGSAEKEGNKHTSSDVVTTENQEEQETKTKKQDGVQGPDSKHFRLISPPAREQKEFSVTEEISADATNVATTSVTSEIVSEKQNEDVKPKRGVSVKRTKSSSSKSEQEEVPGKKRGIIQRIFGSCFGGK